MLTIADRDARSAPKRARFFSVVAFVPLLLLAAGSFAAPIVVPASLLPSQPYRLAFVTAGTRDATSIDIADYDAFVTAEANTEAALSSISWQVIGSTEFVSARDHTGTAPGDFPGVPIFLLDGVKLVDDYEDLWDGTVDVPFWIDQHGEYAGSANVWTGTGLAGLVDPYPLGSLEVAWGTTWWAAYWIHFDQWGSSASSRLYALSEVLTVPVPEPGPTTLLALGLAAILLVRRVRRPLGPTPR